MEKFVRRFDEFKSLKPQFNTSTSPFTCNVEEAPIFLKMELHTKPFSNFHTKKNFQI